MADDLGLETVSLAKASGEGVKCICHNPNFPAHQPLKRLTETTWTTLWNAAETKRDDTWMSIGNLDRETCGEVLYHKACYKWYTNKKTLKKTAVAESGPSRLLVATKAVKVMMMMMTVTTASLSKEMLSPPKSGPVPVGARQI